MVRATSLFIIAALFPIWAVNADICQPLYNSNTNTSPEIETKLAPILKAHGGLQRFKKIRSVNVSFRGGGRLFRLLGKTEMADLLSKGLNMFIDFRSGISIITPFRSKNERLYWDEHSDFIEIQKYHRDSDTWRAVEHRRSPRKFSTSKLIALDDLTIAYFGAYTLKSYVKGPFKFLEDGVKITKISETPQHTTEINVTYPPGYHSHSTNETYFFDQGGRLLSQIYHPQVLGQLLQEGIQEGQNKVIGYVEAEGLALPARVEARMIPDSDLRTLTYLTAPFLAPFIEDAFFNQTKPIMDWNVGEVSVINTSDLE